MKLIQKEIEKNIDLSENWLLRKWYKKHFWKQAVAYNLALNVLGQKDLNVKKKNKLWAKFLLSPERIDSRNYIKLQKLMSEQNAVISQAFQYIEEMKTKNVYSSNEIFKHTRTLAPIGILSYEVPE